MMVFQPEERDAIRAFRKQTICYVLAQQGNCLDLAIGRVKAVTGRSMQLLDGATFPRDLPYSWMLAVVICPGDDTTQLGSWASRLSPPDLARIRFYEPHELEETADRIYEGWTNKGLPDPWRIRVHGFKELNRVLGGDLNVRILEDHVGAKSST